MSRWMTPLVVYGVGEWEMEIGRLWRGPLFSLLSSLLGLLDFLGDSSRPSTPSFLGYSGESSKSWKSSIMDTTARLPRLEWIVFP